MALKTVMDNVDELDESVRKLYTEKDGKFVLTGIEGVKTQADIDRLQNGNKVERDAHKATREKYKAFDPFIDDIEGTIAKLDEYDTLKAAAAGKIDDTKLNEMVENRLKGRTAPIERKVTALEKENGDLKAENQALKDKEQRRVIHDHVREASTKSKMVETAVEDALFLAERIFTITEDGKVVTKDGVGVTPDVDATVWLTEMQAKRPHWWPESKGGGARAPGGGGGFTNNPWTFEHWNVTEQGRVYRENSARAEQMARSAGTEIGGAKPKPKN